MTNLGHIATSTLKQLQKHIVDVMKRSHTYFILNMINQSDSKLGSSQEE